ncbi:MAG: amidohydrolase [Proteobacteria bacterium]|nr:amidohydrolase [Pseudomonadota bacterium]
MPPKLPETLIDSHVHLFPDKGFDAIWKAFDQMYQVPVLHHLYHQECIEYLRARQVGPIVYSNYAHKPGIAGSMNAWNRELLNRSENLFCYAAFHPEDDEALAMAEDILSHPQVMGIKLHFLIQHYYPHDSRFFPLYELIMDRKKRLLMHLGTGPIGNQYTGLDHFKILLKRYPDLPVTIPHMGGYEYKGFLDLLDDHPDLYLDTAYSFWHQAPGGYDQGTEALERYQDRIVYGSDFPNIILPRKDEIEGLLSYDLSSGIYSKLFYENGARLIQSACPECIHFCPPHVHTAY